MLKESIADFSNIAKTIKENTSETVKTLLGDVVAKEYVKIMAEGFDKDDEEEKDDAKEETTEIEDTEAEDTSVDAEEETTETDSDNEGEESETAEEDTEVVDDNAGVEEEDSTPEGWSDFNDYKIDGEDGQYDFSQADDETIVKVYKLLKDSDEVVVTKNDDNSKLELKDNQTGAEYIIDLNSDCCEDGTCDCGDDEEGAFGDEDLTDESIKESKMIEIVLTENSNLGYTDNYQSKDVMTTPNMSEPGKNVNDWDAGVPKGKSKPWAGANTPKKGKPFTEEDEMDGGEEAIEESEKVPTKDASNWGLNHTAKKGHKVPVTGTSDWGTKCTNECGDVAPMEEEDELEEANLSQSRWNDTHAAHNRVPAANQDAHRREGMQKTSKGTSYRANGGSSMDEAILKKHKKIVAENKAMKQTLDKLQKLVAEAAVTNMNLGQIVKILNENSTTQDEKREIISRFSKEAKTIQESKSLYEKITRELQKKNTMNINEDKQFTATNSQKLNESAIYASPDLMSTLDLMHKICK